MASGDPVIKVIQIVPPGTGYATFDVRPGGSTPPENVPVWDFDAASSEYLDFLCTLEGYSGGGLTFSMPWMASSATSGTVRWEMGIRAFSDEAEDIDASHSYQFNGVSDPAPSASGQVSYGTVAFTDGADMDNWLDGEFGIVRVYRDHDHADDGMTGDAELLGISGLET
jgi:hypothetical protein